MGWNIITWMRWDGVECNLIIFMVWDRIIWDELSYNMRCNGLNCNIMVCMGWYGMK